MADPRKFPPTKMRADSCITILGGMATTRLADLIDRYTDSHGVSDSELARRIGISRENIRLWRKGLRSLPDQANLHAVARIISQPYRQVLSAALFDSGYLTETDTHVPRPHDEVLNDAISVLTEAAHLTNQPMRHTSSGQWEPDPDPRAAVATSQSET
jgi:transcriptional regulator with XRE-family HTH domain